jgi:hypothetical protein
MVNRTLFFALSAVILASTMTTGNAAGAAPPFDLRGSVSGGASLQDLEGESYGAKLLPSVGGALSIFAKSGKTVRFGFELSYDHHFQSNDKNYYYYSAYERFGLTPLVELSTQGSGVRLYALGGLGVSVVLSGYTNDAFVSSALGAGIRFQKSFIHGILVMYSHGFLEDYDAFEAYKAGVVFRLFDKGAQ